MPGDSEPHQIIEPNTSLGDLMSRLTTDVGDLVEGHIRLATSEITEEVKTAGTGVGILGGSAVAALLAILMVSLSAAWALAEVVEQWLAFLIVAAVWGVAAAALAASGRSKLDDVDGLTETKQEFERDKRWMNQ